MDHSGPRVPPPHGDMNIEQEPLLQSSAQSQIGLQTLSQLGLSENNPTVQVNLAQQHENLAQSHQSGAQSQQSSHRGDAQSHQHAHHSSASSLAFSSSSLESCTQTPSSGSGDTAMPSQNPILPQDRSCLNQGTTEQSTSQQPVENTQQMKQFHQQLHVIKQHLVYQPRNPQQPLPPTEQHKNPLPKTPKPKVDPRMNDPPEANERLVGENVIAPEDLEIRRMMLRQQQQQQESQPSRNTSFANAVVSNPREYRTTNPCSTPSSSSNSSGDNTSLVSSSSSSAVQPHPGRVLQLPQAHNYEELDVIGNGAYGTVYRGRDLSDQGRFVALKKIKITLTEDGVPVSAVREISLLKQLETFKHPNIVRLLDICHGRLERENRLNLVLVFEYVEMDLDTYLKRVPSPGLEPPRIRNLMYQILNGVDFLHCNRIIHRDLKPQNILVDRYDRVKIADFGLARIYDYNMKLTTMVVTLWYRAPEVLLSNSYSTPVDIWSCACIFAELFRKRPLFEGQNEGEQLQRIFEVIGTPSERDWPSNVPLCFSAFRSKSPKPLPDVVPEIPTDAADLLQRMLAFVPDIRASARQSLRHQYFDGLDTDDTQQLLSVANTTDRSLVTTAPSSSSTSATTADVQQQVSSMVCDDDDGDESGGGGVSSKTSLSTQHQQSVQSRTVVQDMIPHQMVENTRENLNRLSSSSDGGGVVVVSKADHVGGTGNDENNPNSSNINSKVAAQSSSSISKLISNQLLTPGPTSSSAASTAGSDAGGPRTTSS